MGTHTIETYIEEQTRLIKEQCEAMWAEHDEKVN